MHRNSSWTSKKWNATTDVQDQKQQNQRDKESERHLEDSPGNEVEMACDEKRGGLCRKEDNGKKRRGRGGKDRVGCAWTA